ncbi:MAG TPA: hypothetical protein VLH80_07445 [Nitrospiraceae bacterium]|nr:hypothetical protein [Nitrospiraceae bacterium]
MPTAPIPLTLTWTPAETGITEIDSYTIFRAVDGGAQTVLVECAVLRDFLGGIIGVENCTTVPSIPTDDTSSGSVYTVVTNEDAPITYVDETVQIGHQYCYQIMATPMGNNQSVAQGPPISSNIACLTESLSPPTLSGWYNPGGPAANTVWSLPVGEFLAVTGWSLYRSVNGGAYALLTSLAANVLSYADTAVSSGNTYSYYVTYTAASLTSPQSTPFAVIVP